MQTYEYYLLVCDIIIYRTNESGHYYKHNAIRSYLIEGVTYGQKHIDETKEYYIT